nr:metallophosphoesterase [Cognataquiflexum nitidum]
MNSWPQAPLLAQSGLEPKVAFLADIHLHDVYGDFDAASFQGVLHPGTSKMATLKTMLSQMNSTRLFNENYFAFLEALEDLRKRNIKYVVLPGDFSDDGQPMNVKLLKTILDQYAEDFGMRFFITTGNHDPVTPFGGVGSNVDYIGAQGRPQTIAGFDGNNYLDSIPRIEQINYWGYYEICKELGSFGFFPDKKDIFWSHPFLELDYEGYEFEKALVLSEVKNRLYEVGDSGYFLPDASYVVEPVEGIWLLAIDGNVYGPRYGEDNELRDWSGSGIGFNLAAQHKQHQLKWIKNVTAEAKKRGKTLLSFSHYPLADFHDGTSEKMSSVFGINKFQLVRVPTHQVSDQYAEAGIRVHLAGHMHLNDTGIHWTQSGKSLINIQVPSLAAFPPAYKIVSQRPDQALEITTVPLYEVPRFDEFFDVYRMEHDHLSGLNTGKIWDKSILSSKSYLGYTLGHLKQLIHLRFLSSDWPADLASLLEGLTEEEILFWAQLDDVEGNTFLAADALGRSEMMAKRGGNIGFGNDSLQVDKEGTNLMMDFYLIKNGGQLGNDLIPSHRLRFYSILTELSFTTKAKSNFKVQNQLIDFLWILGKMMNSYPSDHFLIYPEEGKILDLGK